MELNANGTLCALWSLPSQLTSLDHSILYFLNDCFIYCNSFAHCQHQKKKKKKERIHAIKGHTKLALNFIEQ